MIWLIFPKNTFHRYVFYFLFLLAFLSCAEQTRKKTVTDNEEITAHSILVKVQILKDQTFQKQIVANGLAKAAQKTELRFKSSNRIDKILVRNGDRVSKGQVLAVLDNRLLANQLQKAKIQLTEAGRKLKVLKINYGASQNDGLDTLVLRNLKSESGWLAAKNAVENMQILYDQTSIEAPFSGTVANIQTKPGNYITSGEVFCTLIDQTNFEVYFSILEGELPFVKIGQEVEISHYANPGKKYKGRISEINPMVGENGLVEIKAAVKNTNGALIEGMHVKVFVNKPIGNVVVVPKEAVVLRSNREVVFTTENGLAKWNYVEVLFENTTSYALKEGIEIGDTIIVSGNMNLAHDAKVNATFLPSKPKNDG